MIRATLQYLRDEARPRWREIIGGWEFWISMGIGLAVWLKGSRGPLSVVKAGDLGTALLTYSAIALGFCLAGLTLAITLPDRQFATKLAESKPNKKKTDAYSDLLFVFSWTAIIHWVSVVMALLIILVWPGETILAQESLPVRRVLVGAVAAVSAYAFFQFLITLVTLSQVGRAYIESLRESGNKRG